MKRIVAISSGPSTHIDHLAPLCDLLNIPLILTEPDHLAIAKKFYPMIQAECISLGDLTLDRIAKSFDVVIQTGSKFWGMEILPMLDLLFNKTLRVIYSPHGNSDKENLHQGATEKDIEFIYGPQMRRDAISKNLVETGNLRLFFYKKYKSHFDSLAKPFFFSEKKSVLYAPTWKSVMTETSFFEETDAIVKQFADSFHLLVKPHPRLEENNPGKYYHLLEKYKDKVQFILDFPTIYPLLEKTDIYLGDYSSIGYDFLYYNRPLFFLRGGGELQSAGKLFTGSLDDPQTELNDVREDLYEFAFGKKVFPEKIKALIYEKLGLESEPTLQ